MRVANPKKKPKNGRFTREWETSNCKKSSDRSIVEKFSGVSVCFVGLRGNWKWKKGVKMLYLSSLWH